MLQSIEVRGYRSLREFRLKLSRVTVVTGGNGVGKSNVYRALALLQRMAEGRFAEALAGEGGMPSALWAGERRKDEPRRISWEIKHSDFEFHIECGMVALGPESESLFRTDPEIKNETLLFAANPTADPITTTLRFDGNRVLTGIWGPPDRVAGDGKVAVDVPAYTVRIWSVEGAQT